MQPTHMCGVLMKTLMGPGNLLVQEEGQMLGWVLRAVWPGGNSMSQEPRVKMPGKGKGTGDGGRQ
jgi:hypothetical protein